MKVTSILAATDFSPEADEGLRQAHVWAQAWGAKLTACHASPLMSVASPLFPQEQREWIDLRPKLAEGAAQTLRRRVREVTGRAEEEFQIALAEGSAPTGILESAQQIHADLIVVGGRAHSAVGEWLLGGVAEEVVRGAPVPVLVARPSSPPRRFLAAVDLAEGSRQVVEAALAARRKFGADVTLLHVLYLEDPLATRLGLLAGGPVPTVSPEVRAGLRRMAAESLQSMVEDPDVPARIEVQEGPPAGEISRLARKLEASLIIVGNLSARRAHRILLGGAAAKVVRHAPCSVLVLRLF